MPRTCAVGLSLHLHEGPVDGRHPTISGDDCFVSLKCPLLPTPHWSAGKSPFTISLELNVHTPQNKCSLGLFDALTALHIFKQIGYGTIYRNPLDPRQYQLMFHCQVFRSRLECTLATPVAVCNVLLTTNYSTITYDYTH